jgi:hypothetical protein
LYAISFVWQWKNGYGIQINSEFANECVIVSYLSGNSKYGKQYGTVGNVLPYAACVIGYGKNILVSEMRSHLGCLNLSPYS